MTHHAINLAEKLGAFSENWTPKIVARMNDLHFKVVKVCGEFVWHSHPETDEAFLVLDGEMRIDFRDGNVSIGAGELFVVPKGVEHKPVAERECRVLLVEPAGTVNTGDAGGTLTAPADDWI